MFQGKARSALAIALNVAKHHPNTVDVLSLSGESGFSISYIEQVMCYLRRAKLIKGVRGPGGGYCLSTSPDEITVADISSAMDRDEEEFQDKTVRIAFSRICSEQHKLFKQMPLSRLIA